MRQTDRWFNSGLIKEVNEQCLATNEGWEAVLTDRCMESNAGPCSKCTNTYSIVHINKLNTLFIYCPYQTGSQRGTWGR